MGDALVLWILCELSICATDLAEVIGTAMALQLLFGIPIAELNAWLLVQLVIG